MQSRDARPQSAARSGAQGLGSFSALATRLTQQAWRGLPLPASPWGACQGASLCFLDFPFVTAEGCCIMLCWAASSSPFL